MTDFDGLRCAIAVGNGVVARFPGVVCVAGVASRQATAHLNTVLQICKDASGGAPGRAIARQLASWLGNAGEGIEHLRFGTVSATEEDGLAVFLVGEVNLLIPDLAADISGMDAASWTDRLMARPDSPVVLSLSSEANAVDAAAGPFDLHSGIVPGDVAVLLQPGTGPGQGARRSEQAAGTPPPIPARPVRQPAAPPTPPAAVPAVQPTQATRAAQPVHRPAAPPPPPPPSPPPPSPPPALAPPRRAEPIFGAPVEERRSPLPSGGREERRREASAARSGAPESEEPQTQGHLCSRGHLNDPRSHFCVLCGIRMNERTGVLVLGPRPPLGLLVFNTGTTFTVDADYVIGRQPEVDERVASGVMRAIPVEDHTGSVSRVHAEVRLEGWDVLIVDSGSSNGTYVASQGEDWSQLRPQEARRLTQGTKVRLGECSFVFESPSGVR
ncbi:FHA domain-containing protein [Actinomycetes bacterium KLBMP 9759]